MYFFFFWVQCAERDSAHMSTSLLIGCIYIYIWLLFHMSGLTWLTQMSFSRPSIQCHCHSPCIIPWHFILYLITSHYWFRRIFLLHREKHLTHCVLQADILIYQLTHYRVNALASIDHRATYVGFSKPVLFFSLSFFILNSLFQLVSAYHLEIVHGLSIKSLPSCELIGRKTSSLGVPCVHVCCGRKDTVKWGSL